MKSGDAVEFTVRWNRTAIGKTASRIVAQGADISTLWEKTHCHQSLCEYKVIFSVDEVSPDSAIEVHLVNRGTPVKSWHRKLIPTSS